MEKNQLGLDLFWPVYLYIKNEYDQEMPKLMDKKYSQFYT